MSDAIKDNTDYKTLVLEVFEKISWAEKMEIFRLLLTPEMLKQIEREKDFDELFQIMERLWKLNKNVDDDELEKDVQEAVDYARSKTS